MSDELVSHKNNHAEEITEFFSSNERLEDLTQRRDYFEHLDENDFLDLVQQAAGLVRTGDVENQYFDGEKAGLMGHEVPDQREKEQLLRDTWTVAKEFLSDTDIPDEDALDYAALTVAGGLLYAHSFADGNGRTSRVLSYMIAHGSGDKLELHDILTESNGGKAWSVMPLQASEQATFEGNQPESIEWTPKDEATFFAENMPDALGGRLSHSRYGEWAIRKFIEQYGHTVERQITESSSVKTDGTVSLNGEKFIAELVYDPEAGMTYAHELLNMQRKYRASAVHGFLDAMRSDQRVQPHKTIRNLTGDAPEHVTSNEFLNGVWQTASRELGRRAIDGLVTQRDRQLTQHRAYSQIRHERGPEQGVAV